MKKNPEVFKVPLEKEKYEDDDIKNIINLVKENGGIDSSVELAKKYTKKAFRDINKLPDNEYKEILLEVTTKLLERKY